MASRKSLKQEEARRKREARAAEKAAGETSEEKTKRERTTEREMTRRLAEAEGYLLRGWTDRRVAAEMAHTYGLTLRSGQDYVSRVKEMWAERVAARKEIRSEEEIDREHRDRALWLLDEAVKAGDRKVAATMVQRLMELDGRGTSRKIELGGGLKHTVDASPDMLNQAEEILRRHGYEPPKEGGGDGFE